MRDAAWKIEMNAKRIETTRAARELAEQRLDAERKRFEVGMSTSFLVIQAQRDLAQAKTNELGAVLAVRPVARRLRSAAAGRAAAGQAGPGSRQGPVGQWRAAGPVGARLGRPPAAGGGHTGVGASVGEPVR